MSRLAFLQLWRTSLSKFSRVKFCETTPFQGDAKSASVKYSEPSRYFFPTISLAATALGLSITQNDAISEPEHLPAENSTHGHLTGAASDDAVSNSHTARWRVFTDTGRDLFSQGRVAEAAKYFHQAVEEAKLGFGPKDPHVASACNNLAELYRIKKEYSKAEPLYLEAIDRLKTCYGPQHHIVALALHNLGGFYLLQRKYEQSQHFYEESLKTKGETLGKHHPEYANTLFHLGEVMRLQGRGSDAIELFRDSVKILEENGSGHTIAAIKRMGRLAEILVSERKLEEAEQLQRKLLHIMEVTQGDESLGVAIAAENLGSVLKERGKLDDGLQMLQRALNVRMAILNSSHCQVGMNLFKIGQLAVFQGRESMANGHREVAAEKLQGGIDVLRRAEKTLEGHWKSFASKQPPVISLPWLHALASTQLLLGEAIVAAAQVTNQEEKIKKSCQDAATVLKKALQLLSKANLREEVFLNDRIMAVRVRCLQQLSDSTRTEMKLCKSERRIEELRKDLEDYKKLATDQGIDCSTC